MGIEELNLKATVAEVVDRWLCAGPAACVIRDGALEWFLGHGVATAEGQEPVTENTVFRIAPSPRPSLPSPGCNSATGSGRSRRPANE